MAILVLAEREPIPKTYIPKPILKNTQYQKRYKKTLYSDTDTEIHYILKAIPKNMDTQTDTERHYIPKPIPKDMHTKTDTDKQ